MDTRILTLGLLFCLAIGQCYSYAGNAPYPNSGPYSSSQADFQAFIQQQLRQLQAQQEAFQAQIEAQRQIFLEMSNRIGNGNSFPQYPNGPQGAFPPRFGAPQGGFPQYGGPQGGSFGSGPHSAVASANIGPQGGFQSGQISPVAPGIHSRFDEPLPPPRGGSYGVFSSSSSSSSIGPDGKEKSFKQATTGVNDNGKVSFHTVRDP